MRRKTFVVHFEDKCSDEACDLCAARRRKEREDALLEAKRPTLTHQPFAALLTAGAGKRTVTT